MTTPYRKVLQVFILVALYFLAPLVGYLIWGILAFIWVIYNIACLLEAISDRAVKSQGDRNL